MWPWEHLAVGYVLVSVLWRARGRIPDAPTAVATAVGTQFPDLVDKPLAWGFGLLERGMAVAHSVLVAVPLCLLAVALARRYGYGPIVGGFALGYLSHLPADAVYSLFYGNGINVGAFLWPVARPPATPRAGSPRRSPSSSPSRSHC